MKARVLVVCFPSDYSGVPIYCKKIIRSLSASVEFSLLTSGNGQVFNELRANLIVERSLRNSLNPLHLLRNLILLIRTIRTERPDIVHLNGSMFGFIGRLVAPFFSAKFVFTYHGIPWGPGRGVFYNVLMICLESIALLVPGVVTVAISKMDVSRLQRINFAGKRLVYVPNSVDLIDPEVVSVAASGKDPSLGLFRILCVARFSPQKNYARLFQAFHSLSNQYELVVVGAGTDSKDCKELASSICTVDDLQRIQFVGESTRVLEFLRSADIFCLSSDYEGMPLSAIEALAVGVPIVMPDVGGAIEFESSGAAVIYRPNEAGALAHSIEEIAADHFLREKMSGAGARAYETLFSPKNFTQRMAKAYGLEVAV